MMKPKLSEVSHLALVDTLAALPMEHVVRVARLATKDCAKPAP